MPHCQCVVEVFTFLAMGGVHERIITIPLAGPDASHLAASTQAREEAFYAQLTSFRAEEAQCFRAEEREWLLAVIETSFGDLRTFNTTVRSLFKSSLHQSYCRVPLPGPSETEPVV